MAKIRHKRRLAARLMEYSGLRQFLTWQRSWKGLVVLNYHRINDAELKWDRCVVSATPEQFAEQMRYLSSHAEPVGLEDFGDILSRKREGRFVHVTFDDGYADNHELAFPLMQAYGVRGTFFITTGFLDQGTAAWWDEIAWMVRHAKRKKFALQSLRGETFQIEDEEEAILQLLRAYKQLPGEGYEAFLDEIAEQCGSGRVPARLAALNWMTWDMVRDLRKHGMTIGAHTVTHPVLSRISVEQQKREIQVSKSRIETELGETIRAFSYPVGLKDSFTAETEKAVLGLGFDYAFSFYGGHVSAEIPQATNIPRIAMDKECSMSEFRALCTLPGMFG